MNHTNYLNRLGVAMVLIWFAITLGVALKDPVTKFVNKGLAVYGEAIAKSQTLPGK